MSSEIRLVFMRGRWVTFSNIKRRKILPFAARTALIGVIIALSLGDKTGLTVSPCTTGSTISGGDFGLTAPFPPF
jgi:sorbitol-specific phosphotransferase system component IIBC